MKPGTHWCAELFEDPVGVQRISCFAMSKQLASDSIQSSSIQAAAAPAPSLTTLSGVVPVLPCEMADLYQTSLDALIDELGARSVLQVYLAEKIHCGEKASLSRCTWCYITLSTVTRVIFFAKVPVQGECYELAW